MRLSVGDLLAAPHAVRVLPLSEWLQSPAEDVTLVEPIGGELTLTSTGRTVCLSGRVRAVVELVCGACLGGYRQALEFAVAEEFGRVAAASAEEDRSDPELGPEDFVTPLAPGDLIDVAEVLQQHLVLALPIAPRCRDDCRGLCAQCGADLNTGRCACHQQDIDPRLLPLQRWSPPAADRTAGEMPAGWVHERSRREETPRVRRTGRRERK